MCEWLHQRSLVEPSWGLQQPAETTMDEVLATRHRRLMRPHDSLPQLLDLLHAPPAPLPPVLRLHPAPPMQRPVHCPLRVEAVPELRLETSRTVQTQEWRRAACEMLHWQRSAGLAPGMRLQSAPLQRILEARTPP